LRAAIPVTRLLFFLVIVVAVLLVASRVERAPATPQPKPAAHAMVTRQPVRRASKGTVTDQVPSARSETGPIHSIGAGAAPVTPESPEVRTPILARLARMEGRRRLQFSGHATYLDSLFTTPDSVVRRWSDQAVIRIALAAPPGATDLLAEVRAALRSWRDVGLDLRFVEVADTVGADVVVSWTDRFESPPGLPDSASDKTGLTELRSNPLGEIQSARIMLARSDRQGPLRPDELRSIAAHEFGHALGLPHSGSRDDIMYPIVLVHKLSARDRASAELLYQLPPGSLHEPPP